MLILLNGGSQTLEAVLAGAITTSQLRVFVAYVDIHLTTYAPTPGNQGQTTNNTTPVTILSVVGSGSIRQVKSITIPNRDTAAATITVNLISGGTTYQQVKVTLAVNDSLCYEDGHGWYVIDSSGQRKSSASGGGAGFSDAEGDPAGTGTAADGASTYAARRDHVHPVTWNDAEGNPAAIGVAADGTSVFPARRDHVHAGDHTALASIGTNTHAQIDTHIAGSWAAKHANGAACWCYHNANISIAHATEVIVSLNTENLDNDNMHYTSSANLTGTVSKTSGSATITGSGTSFTSELSVGQCIAIPGTATERFTVIAIASNTSLTVERNAANSASGQVAVRLNSPIVIRTAGLYIIGGIMRFASNSSGLRQALIIKNIASGTTTGGTILVNSKVAAVNGDSTDWALGGTPVALAQWDRLELVVLQNSGGALNVESVAVAEPSLWAYQIGT